MADCTDMEELLKAHSNSLTFTKKGIEHRKDGKIVLYYGIVPSENVVEVVRCKDCKHHHPYHCSVWSKFGIVQTNDDGYCYMAERKEDC